MKVKSIFAGVVSGILVCLGLLLTTVMWLITAAVRIITGMAGKIR